jgi:hypothetical protein
MIEDFARPEWAYLHDRLATDLVRSLWWVGRQLSRRKTHVTSGPKMSCTLKDGAQAPELQ